MFTVPAGNHIATVSFEGLVADVDVVELRDRHLGGPPWAWCGLPRGLPVVLDTSVRRGLLNQSELSRIQPGPTLTSSTFASLFVKERFLKNNIYTAFV